MNLIECGELYTLDSKNFISNDNKNIKLSEETKNVSNVIIDYVVRLFQCFPSAVYVRGSCLKRKISDPTVCDIDLLFVFADKDCDKIREQELQMGFYKIRYFKDKNKLDSCKHKKNIENKISNFLGFSVQTDLKFMSEEMFIDDKYTRFFCKKIYGFNDLSISTLHLDTLNEISHEIAQIKINHLNKDLNLIKNCLSNNANIEDVKKDTIKRVIKLFYRYCSWDLFLKNGVYSRDLYYCHQIIVEKYKNYLNDLNEILDLFLNTDLYSNERIISVIDKITHFISNYQ